jgi:hypothetical protein
VSNCKAGQRVLFSIVNFSKSRSLFREGMSPLVCSSSRPTWERIPAKNCFYYRSPKANNGCVLSPSTSASRLAPPPSLPSWSPPDPKRGGA